MPGDPIFELYVMSVWNNYAGEAREGSLGIDRNDFSVLRGCSCGLFVHEEVKSELVWHTMTARSWIFTTVSTKRRAVLFSCMARRIGTGF